MRAHSGGTAEAMRSQQAQGSQQAELTAGSEVTEVPEPRGCTAAQGASTQSLSTAVAAAAAVAAALLTLGQRRQDSGGSKSCGTGRGQGTMGLALRLFLLLLLAVALPARAAQGDQLQARRADWNRDTGFLQVLMNAGLKFMENAGAEPVAEGDLASQPMSRTEPLGDGEGVSAGRTSPAPGLDDWHQPSSHRRGPPTGKFQDTTDNISKESSKHLKQLLKEILHRAQDEAAAKASPLAWLHKTLKALEPPAGVSAGRISPAAPLLVAAHKPSSHRRGPLRVKSKPRGEKKSFASNKILKQIVEELHKGNEMKGEPVPKEAFPGGSSDSVPASAAGREAMAGPVTGDWDPEMDYLEVLAHNHFKSLEDAEAKPAGEGDAASQPMSRTKPLGSRTEPLGDGEVIDQNAGQKEVFPQGGRGRLAAPAAGRKAMPDTGTGEGSEGAASPTTHVPDSQKDLGRGFCKGTRCLLEFIAIVASGEIVFMFCCFGIWYSWKRKRDHLEGQCNAVGWSRDFYSRKSNSSSSESEQLITVVPQSSAVL